ncbi:MAG: hypothetical protein K8953_07625, partial [Proteobacteria bacterium]|nr:hypothetical protein [Pseudomonadota bacterium]
DTSANWRGVFAVGNAKTDFTLNINFANGGGTIAARIRASVDFDSPESGAFYYQLDGDFDASGLITGDVYYGRSLNSERPAKTGILTGLIGAEGAVGAFYSIATGDLGYSGGFVANDEATAFDDTTVRYETWARSFLLDDKADTNDRRNQFLRTAEGSTELNTVGGDSRRIINLNEAEFNDESIGGAATTRYQSFDVEIATVYSNYLGILPGTDLGVPVVNGSTELTWYGNFTENYSDVIGTRSADFVLKLTFNSGMNDGVLAARINYQNSAYYILKGTFDAGGLITGTVAFDVGDFNDTVNGVLTGIIGSDGAIGVFHGTDLENVTSLNYGGGFVARPKSGTFTDSVKYSDWLARENPDANPSAENEFLQTTAVKGVNTGTVTVTSEFTLNLNTAVFDGAPILGDADAGFAGLFGTISATRYAYAGIYQMTDLGAPLTQTSGSLMWNGVIRLGGTESSTEFTISFNGTGGRIDAFELNFLNDDDLFISGTFDDLGLITGDVHFADFTTQINPSPPPNPDGTLSGLIGAEGAVGVFHTIVSNNRYSGGFVASPYVKLQANWNDWEDRNNFDNEISADPRQNQFLSGYHGALSGLQIASTSGAETATGFTIGLNDGTFTDEATYGDVRLGGNGTGGIIYWHGFQEDDAERLYYAQIHTDTKLGAIIEE